MKLIIALASIIASSFGNQILNEVPLVDGHNDLPYNLYNLEQNNLENFKFDTDLINDTKWGSESCNSCYTDLPRLRAGKVGAQFWVAYVSCETQYKDSLAKTIEQIDVIKRLVQKYPNDLTFVTTAAGITSAFNNGKIASLIGVEGGHSMDSRLGVLRMLYDLGTRYMTLTHSCSTPWADNSYVDDTTPVLNLTAYGKLVIQEMNRIGMMVDLSHVSHAVMNEAIATSRAPIIFSHSSAYEIYNHNRNVKDDTLKLVKENNGIVMVNFASIFVGPTLEKSSITDVARHINYIADVAGIDHVGIGGDYDGVSRQPIGLEDVSKYPDLFNLLQQQNATKWTNENLKKLASGNFLRVFKQVEEVRDQSSQMSPVQNWIPFEDLNDSQDSEKIWKCRTLLNNKSPVTSKGNQKLPDFALYCMFSLLTLVLLF